MAEAAPTPRTPACYGIPALPVRIGGWRTKHPELIPLRAIRAIEAGGSILKSGVVLTAPLAVAGTRPLWQIGERYRLSLGDVRRAAETGVGTSLFLCEHIDWT
jgi:hypothetical protein